MSMISKVCGPIVELLHVLVLVICFWSARPSKSTSSLTHPLLPCGITLLRYSLLEVRRVLIIYVLLHIIAAYDTAKLYIASKVSTSHLQNGSQHLVDRWSWQSVAASDSASPCTIVECDEYDQVRRPKGHYRKARTGTTGQAQCSCQQRGRRAE